MMNGKRTSGTQHSKRREKTADFSLFPFDSHCKSQEKGKRKRVIVFFIVVLKVNATQLNDKRHYFSLFPMTLKNISQRRSKRMFIFSFSLQYYSTTKEPPKPSHFSPSLPFSNVKDYNKNPPKVECLFPQQHQRGIKR